MGAPGSRRAMRRQAEILSTARYGRTTGLPSRLLRQPDKVNFPTRILHALMLNSLLTALRPGHELCCGDTTTTVVARIRRRFEVDDAVQLLERLYVDT
ncbi:hypothetical protein LTR15_009045 [Elasticomyces elasticus]|nr:hypothetical protein LTR15_009045 [Elasticomyces elasticus]